ncbi:M20/M25/M40 family metallo-hydrolase [Akkermansiaceae bacterium]|nr:M20/M25/M40 family metallo-hydrolase [Akkermansiaceae bacterium]
MNSVVELLQALVRIPSVNPDGEPDVSPGGEEKMAKFIGEFLEPLGFTITYEDAEPGRPNVIARAPSSNKTPGSHDRPRILLGPHLDTVTVKGMTVEPWTADISGGKMWGRGTSDTKGPMAAMLWGLKENAGLLAELPVAVDLIGFSGEESRQPGSQHFAKHHASEYEFAIVGEPTSLEAVYCTKGCLWATLEAKGKASHASKPELGENAILKLTHLLHRLDDEFKASLQEFSHPVLEKPSLNIGVISGGVLPNIVPEDASALVDIRTVPEMVESQSASERLREWLVNEEIELTKAAEYPPMEMSEDHPWLKKISEIQGGLTLTGAPWFSDAAHLSKAGLSSICLGPGSIDQAHKADEFIKISDLEEGAEWFTKFIQGLA